MYLQLALLLAAVISGIASGWMLSSINSLYIMRVDPYSSTKWIAACWIIACGTFTIWSVFLIILT